MAINVNGYSAQGPFTNPQLLEDRSGVYLILTRNGNGTTWTVVDIGESHAVRSRVMDHDRRPCWVQNNKGTLSCAAIYATQEQRMLIEQELRDQYSPVCGDR